MRLTLILPAFLFIATLAKAQPLSFNFHRVTTAQGLNMSGTTAISEDKYGYIWLGTVAGLNRFDGHQVKVYEHHFGDSTSLPPSAVRFTFCDSEGRLWISFMNGLMEYDYEKDCFKKYDLGNTTWVTTIIEAKPKQLYIATSNGLLKLNTANGAMTYFDSLNTTGRGWSSQVWEMAKYQNELYLATRNGLSIFNLDTEQHHQVSLPEPQKSLSFSRVAVEPNGNVWLGGRSEGEAIWRTNTRFDAWTQYSDLCLSATGQPNTITNFFVDRQERLWVASSLNGIARYDPGADKFRQAQIEPWMPNGILSAYMGRIYQDRKGQIWVESTKGACYFNPDDNFFQTILPGNEAGADEGLLLSSSIVERPDGQFWIGTGGGLFLYNLKNGQYQRFWNEPGKPPVLHNNLLRSLYLDRQGDLWICTLKGMNLLRAGSQKIEFLGEKEGLPLVLMYSVLEAKDGTIWSGSFSVGGHYYRPPGETKFRPLQEHPVLKPYAGRFGHSILEDSRGWLWFGLDGLGLIWYDPKTQQAKVWERTPQNDTTLVGNYVNSLCEDANGVIWAATSMGLSSIDPTTFKFTNYDRARGLPTNRVSSVIADAQNRLWLGTSKGLLLLDANRKLIQQFDQNDGLPETEFVVLSPARLRDGRLAFPTRRGLLTFYPEAYTGQQPELPLMISNIRVFNQVFNTPTNPENLADLYLPPGKNFFSLELTALHYANPKQIWYAYKMEPYDKDWTYTRERNANYTNVPSGNYVFHYKASIDPNNWNVPEKTLRICVDGYWYLSKWFWGLIGLLAATLGIVAFRRRAQLREAFLLLERKAQALSKEKALVQYENLTQQLNPHFLFNSLASLGSLIRFDQQTASEFLEALSKMYRYILQSRDRETVFLHEEIAFAAHFLKLQNTRFGEALQVRFNVEPSAMERKIVPVTLQNLLENALKHNTLDREDPLIVEVFTKDQYLVVRNNLQRRANVETSNKQGLIRLQSLYQYLSDLPMQVLEDEAFFEVKIPLL